MHLNSRLSLILSMFIFGTLGLLRRYIPFPSSVIAFVRGAFGFLFLLLVVLIKKKTFSKENIKKNLVLLILSGVFLGLNWIFLFEAYENTSISIATVCYYMAPMIVTLLSPIIFKETLTVKKLICVVFATVGIAFVSGVFNSRIEGITGVIYGLIAASLYATIVILNKFIKDLTSFERTIFQLGISAIAILPYILLTEDVFKLELTLPIAILLIISGILHTGIAYALYFGCMDKLSAQTVALYSYIDPIVAIILSAIVLQEKLDIYSVIGIILVIGSTVVSDMNFYKEKRYGKI